MIVPNWCSNRLYFQGPPESTKEQVIQKMNNSGFTELLAHGVHTARALFLLVFHGCIRVDGHVYGREPFSWMTEFGGARVDLNKPIDYEATELAMILNGVFDREKLERLVAFGQGRKFFDTVDQLDAVALDSTCWQRAAELLNSIYYDYRVGPWGNDKDVTTNNERFFRWLNYYSNEREVEKPVVDQTVEQYYHTMFEIIPPQVLPEINGFNGRVQAPSKDNPHRLGSRGSSYGSYVQTYGTKWPGFEFFVGEEDGRVFIDFDTAWSPPNEEYYDALSEHVKQLDRIYFAEQGMGFCGSGVVLAPGTTLWKQSEMTTIYDESKDDELVVDSIQPEWIVGKVGSYGG
ncbi:hypothetical protein pEaSNUABM54_00245 [Erwinia phage pEa_SNUABM_54]|nr:hypothetical protein pEaSNUABM54_00245 [Erwinia phage pEa_SNUABM_54]